MAVLLGSVLLVSIGAVTLLIALDRPVETLVLLITGTLVPTAVAAYAGQQANAAKVAAQKTVVQTNGNMSDLIRTNAQLAGVEAEPKSSPPPKVDRGVKHYIE
jgi:hypothetical protein